MNCQNKIEQLLKHSSFHELKDILPDHKSQNLTDLEKSAWVQVIAATQDSYHALILYNHYKLQSDDILAKIYLITGQYSKVIEMKNKITNKYLLSDAYFGNGQSENAREVLTTLPLDADWYYEMGRYYANNYLYNEAASAMKQSAELYKVNKNTFSYVNAIANLISYLQTLNRFNESEILLLELNTLINTSEELSSEFTAKILINQACYFLDIGKMYKSYRLFLKAKKLLMNYPNSHDSIRLSIQMAYLFMDFGYYSKAIKLLNTIEPKRKYQQFDKFRILSMCHLRSGNFKLSSKALKTAQMYYSSDDVYAKIYFGLDIMEYFFYTGHKKIAQAKFNEIIYRCRDSHDQVAEFIASSRWSWISKNFDLAEKLLTHELCEKFNYYTSFNKLTVAFGYMSQNKFEQAQNLIDDSQFHGFSLQRSYANFLKYICNTKSGKLGINSRLLDLSYQAVTKYDSIELQSVLIKNLSKDLTQNFNSNLLLDINNKLSSRLSGYQKNAFSNNEFNLSNDNKSYVINNGKFVTLTHIEAQQLRTISNQVFIDLNNGDVSFNGEVFNLNSNPVQCRLLQELVIHFDRSLSKEQIANTVFERKDYNPLTDDNLIYVSISRLRKIKPLKDKIICINGEYKLQTTNIVILLAQSDVNKLTTRLKKFA